MTISARMLPAGNCSRRKARRFWGTLGVMFREAGLGDRRNGRPDGGNRRPPDMAGVKFAARIGRGG